MFFKCKFKVNELTLIALVVGIFSKQMMILKLESSGYLTDKKNRYKIQVVHSVSNLKTA